jgi:hypothetical protein
MMRVWRRSRSEVIWYSRGALARRRADVKRDHSSDRSLRRDHRLKLAASQLSRPVVGWSGGAFHAPIGSADEGNCDVGASIRRQTRRALADRRSTHCRDASVGSCCFAAGWGLASFMRAVFAKRTLTHRLWVDARPSCLPRHPPIPGEKHHCCRSQDSGNGSITDFVAAWDRPSNRSRASRTISVLCRVCLRATSSIAAPSLVSSASNIR